MNLKKINKNLIRILLLSLVIGLAGIIFHASVVRAEYTDNNYGECDYGRECDTTTPPAPITGNTEQGSGGGTGPSPTFAPTEKPNGVVEAVSLPFRFVVNKAENFVSQLSASVQLSLPYYSWVILLILAIIMVTQALIDRRKSLSLVKAAKKLKATLDEQSNFLHLIVHNLNTPLTVAKTSIELLESEKESETPALKILKPAALQLETTISDALAAVDNDQTGIEHSMSMSYGNVSFMNSLSQKYFLIPVGVAVFLTIFINAIQLKIGVQRPQFYLIYQLVIALVAAGILANAVRLLKITREQSAVVKESRIAGEKVADIRKKLISQLSNTLSDNLKKLHAGIKMIHDKKVALMLSSGEMALETIAEKVDFASRPQSTVPEQILMSAVVKDIIDKLKVEISSRDIQLKFDYNGDEPVKTFGGELAIALDAAIDNAIRYNRTGGEVEISSKFDGKKLIVNVKDEGQGLTETERENLFKPFSKSADALTDNQTTVGLSLFVAKSALSRVGGKIELSSRTKHGTKVRITLPAEPLN